MQVVLKTINLIGQVGLLWEVHPAMLEITPEAKVKADWSSLSLGNEHLRFKKRSIFGMRNMRETDSWWSP